MKKILITSALAALALMPASAQKAKQGSVGYPISTLISSSN